MKRWENTKLIFVLIFSLLNCGLCSSDFIECYQKFGLSECNFEGSFSDVQSLKNAAFQSNVTLNSIVALKLQNIHFINFSIKSSFYKLDHLKQVVINNCSGLKLLEDIEFDRKLETLEVTNCNVEEAGENSLRNLLRLVTLKLNNNLISALHENVFELSKVETIDLSFNHISWLPERIFHNCVNLRYLKLSTNFIREISATLFVKNKNIVEIILTNNRVLAIERSDALPFKLLKKLDLRGNFCCSEVFNINNSAYLNRMYKNLALCYANHEMLLHINGKIQKITNSVGGSWRESASPEPGAQTRSKKREKNFQPFKKLKDVPSLNEGDEDFDEDSYEEVPTETTNDDLTNTMTSEAVAISSTINNETLSQCWLISLSISASALSIMFAMLYISHRRLSKVSFNYNIPISTLRYESKV